MTTIDLCLRVKPSGNKCSVLLHILALALNPLEHICSLSVLSVHLSFSNTYAMVLAAMFLSFPSLHTCKWTSFIFYSPLSLPISVPHTAYILYSHKNSLSCSSAHHLLTARGGSVTAPHPKKLHQHLQTAFYPTGYKPLSDLMSGFQRAWEKRKYCTFIFITASLKMRITLKWR